MASYSIPQRILMGPGPSNVSPQVLAALSQPTIGHLDPVFVDLMDEIKSLLQYAFQTENKLTMPVSAPGSAGMETCFVNLVEPDDEVIVCQNGVFGGRMKENVERCGGKAIMVENDWGRAVNPADVEKALETNPKAKILAFVHAETSTGAQSDAKTLVEMAHKYGCLTIVDAVTSLGGSKLKVDDWKIDAIYSGTQKCLSCVPGLSPVSFSQAAIEKIENRKSKVQSWFLDLNLVMAYWSNETNAQRSYHHTAPVNSLYALYQSLVMLKDEGLEKTWARHRLHHEVLKAGLEVMGLKMIVPENERLPQLNAVSIPADIEDAPLRKALLDKHNLEIGAGLGTLSGKVWRIGQMGYASSYENITKCLKALSIELNRKGHNNKTEEVIKTADDKYQSLI